MATVELTRDNFEQTVLENDIVIIDFWAGWCGPCKSFAPIYEKVSELFPDVVFGKVETDQERELAEDFQIRSIPTLMIFREKIILFSQAGMLPEKELKELIKNAQELDMEEVRKSIKKRSNGHD
ncbi:MAG: thioredoxin [Magnetococcus sp. DMHC-6]